MYIMGKKAQPLGAFPPRPKVNVSYLYSNLPKRIALPDEKIAHDSHKSPLCLRVVD